jgi:hypothetical protein
MPTNSLTLPVLTINGIELLNGGSDVSVDDIVITNPMTFSSSELLWFRPEPSPTICMGGDIVTVKKRY